MGIATVVGEEVINAHPWLGTFLVPPPPAKKIGEVRVDINRNKADLPEVLEARTVKGFTTVTSETVYNEVDDNEDRQYTFYDADGHLWSDFGEAPSAATSTPPGSSLLGTVGSVPAPGVGTRTATVIGQDSYDHASKSQGQWIREATNALTDGGFEDLGKGRFAGTRGCDHGHRGITRIEGTRWRGPIRQ